MLWISKTRHAPINAYPLQCRKTQARVACSSLALETVVGVFEKSNPTMLKINAHHPRLLIQEAQARVACSNSLLWTTRARGIASWAPLSGWGAL